MGKFHQGLVLLIGLVIMLASCSNDQHTVREEAKNDHRIPYAVIAKIRLDIGRIKISSRARYRADDSASIDNLRARVLRHLENRFSAFGVFGTFELDVLDLYFEDDGETLTAGLVLRASTSGISKERAIERLIEIEVVKSLEGISKQAASVLLIDRLEAKLQLATGEGLYEDLRWFIRPPY